MEQQERELILQETAVLQSLINTVFYLPIKDLGSKGVEPKVIKSVTLNLFNPTELHVLKGRVTDNLFKLGIFQESEDNKVDVKPELEEKEAVKE